MNYTSGFVDTIILVVLALVILGFFNMDVQQILSRPMIESNAQYFWNTTLGGVHSAWDHLREFLLNNWNKVVPTK